MGGKVNVAPLSPFFRFYFSASLRSFLPSPSLSPISHLSTFSLFPFSFIPTSSPFLHAPVVPYPSRPLPLKLIIWDMAILPVLHALGVAAYSF